MLHVGFEEQVHEYKCGASPEECSHSGSCPQYRHIPFDSGLFQQIPYETKQIKLAHVIRKNCARPFNLLKNQTGLENIRVRSQYATMARCTLSSIAVLLIEMTGRRKKKKNQAATIVLAGQESGLTDLKNNYFRRISKVKHTKNQLHLIVIGCKLINKIL